MALAGLGRPTRFGHGEEALTDTDVRDTWEVPKHLVCAEWIDATLKDILATVKEKLGLPNAVALVDDALDELACHVANLCITLDPERVAVGGGLTAQADRVIGTLSRRIKEAVPFPPDICLARYPLEGALRGAVTVALQELRERQ